MVGIRRGFYPGPETRGVKKLIMTHTIAVLRSNPKDAALVRLVKILTRSGRVNCFLWDRQGDFEPAVTDDRVRYIKCCIQAGFNDVKTFFKLFLFQGWLFLKIMASHHDVIHAIDLDTGVIGFLAAKLKSKKFVYQCLDPYYAALPPEWPRFMADWAKKIENFVINRADLFIITDRLRLPQHKGAAPKRILEFPNVPFYDQSELTPSPRKEGFLVGYIGSLTAGRGLKELVEAVGGLDHQGVRLIIGGFGPLEEMIVSMSQNHSNIAFTSWVPYRQLLEMESSFDLFIQVLDPDDEKVYWGSASPNKLYESMAFGKPIIVGKGTLTEKKIAAFGNGVAVTYGSIKELQDAILLFKNDPDLAREMGEKGRAEFQRNFRPDIMENRLTAMYKSLIVSG
jgi:glycosyltransferase involved in cell wall biosynthesis